MVASDPTVPIHADTWTFNTYSNSWFVLKSGNRYRLMAYVIKVDDSLALTPVGGFASLEECVNKAKELDTV